MNIRMETNGRDRLWPFASGTGNSTLKALEVAFRSSLGLGNKLKDARAQVEASGKFTARGAADEARRLAKAEHLPGIVKGSAALERARKSVQERLAKIQPKAIDKTDLVGFFKRESIRDELRRMPREQRDNLLTRNAAELNPEIAAAVFEHVELPWTAPADRLVSPETRAMLTRRMMPADALAEIDELEQAIAYVSPTLAEAKISIQAELAITEPEFEQLARAERPPVIGFLKQVGDRTVPYKRDATGNYSSCTATAEEIESGVFAPDFATYQAAVAKAA